MPEACPGHNHGDESGHLDLRGRGPAALVAGDQDTRIAAFGPPRSAGSTVKTDPGGSRLPQPGQAVRRLQVPAQLHRHHRQGQYPARRCRLCSSRSAWLSRRPAVFPGSRVI